MALLHTVERTKLREKTVQQADKQNCIFSKNKFLFFFKQDFSNRDSKGFLCRGRPGCMTSLKSAKALLEGLAGGTGRKYPGEAWL